MSRVTRYFNIRLRDLMVEKGFKAGQLAMITNVAPASVSLWINGIEMPPDDIQCLIAIWLGVCRDEIWQFKKECFNEIIELSKLHKEQVRLEKKLAGKLQLQNSNEDF